MAFSIDRCYAWLYFRKKTNKSYAVSVDSLVPCICVAFFLRDEKFQLISAVFLIWPFMEYL